MIVHFDLDKNLFPLLSGDRRETEISAKTVSLIKDKEKITGITIKSQSTINKEVLNKFPKLNLIIARTVGLDNIDLKECKARNIAVYNIPNYGPQHVAQHAIALILTSARNIIPANNHTHKGNFLYKNFLGMSLDRKTLGVIGTGKIGLEVIKIAKSLGMRIIAFDIYKNEKASKELNFSYISLNKLLQNSNVITLHIPSTKETKYLLAAKQLKLIKNGAILVNTARGDLISTKDLIKQIKKFKAVCLDVLENELNFSKNNPLLKYDNVIITPHCAFYTDESLKTIAKETLENIKRFEKGDKTSRVV